MATSSSAPLPPVPSPSMTGNRGYRVAMEIAMNALMIGPTVKHPDRDDCVTVVVGSASAWTPNELTVDPPDAGMVKVRWSDSADRTQLY